MFEVRRIEFEVGFLYNVTNFEYLQIYETIYNRLNEAQLKSKLIEIVLPSMRPHIKVLTTCMYKKMGHDYTPEIQALVDNRRKQLASLRDMIDSSLNRETEEVREAARQLTQLIRDLRKGIKSRNAHKEQSTVDKLTIRVQSNEEYQEALEVLHMRPLVDSLADLNVMLSELERERMDDSGEKRHTKDRRRNSYIALKDVLDALNLSVLIENRMGNQEEALHIFRISSGLQAAIINVRREYRKRQTINKNKKKRKEESEGMSGDEQGFLSEELLRELSGLAPLEDDASEDDVQAGNNEQTGSNEQDENNAPSENDKPSENDIVDNDE